jgi:predicted Zn-dependent protease
LKSSRRRLLAAAGLVLAALAARADLPRWLQDLRAEQRFDGVFTTAAPLPSGPVLMRRAPAETREALTKLIAATPNDPKLYALRARAAEEQLDAAAAEADWMAHAKLASDTGTGQLALADFYHRRLRVADEMRALEAAAQAPNPPSERFLGASDQRAWRTFERLIELVNAQALSVKTGKAEYRLWIKRYSRRRALYQRYFSYLDGRKQFAAAEDLLAEYRKVFPSDSVFPVSARASLEESRGSATQAVAVYDRAFRPLWPPALVKKYFALLEKTRNLRTYLGRARAAAAANPADLNAAARIFYYYQQQGNLPAAQRSLVEFRQRKDARQLPWTATDLWTLGRLSEAVHDYDEAARDYHALYALAGAAPADQERALAALVQLLFAAPAQPIQFGSGDLSFYKDIATMDPHPGFLNGILSLLLNSTQPEYRFADQERTAVAYFHRTRAAELLALFDSKYPNSRRRPALKAKLVAAYAVYGDNDGVIRAAREFLAAFPKTPLRTEVALQMAEAYARKDQTQEEFAVYDVLLKELAQRANGVPLGQNAAEADEAQESEVESAEGEEETSPAPYRAPRAARTAARSPEYARVLDRYISRLVSLKRPLDALALLRSELDRNPNDPGLYIRLASFIEQNRLGADMELAYRRAIQHFSSMSWYDRLGRWYLRHRRNADFEALTRKVIDIFAGTELERYLNNTIAGESGNPGGLYLRLNLYAHERFPYDLVFVRNLLHAYSERATWNPAEYDRLLRNYWFYAEDLRRIFFQRLWSRKAGVDIQSLAGASNPAAVQFRGEAEAWRSHFEAAAPFIEATAARFPGDAFLARRAAAIDRSLAAFDPSYAERAVAVTEKLHEFDLRDRAALTTAGEIYADRGQLAKARPYWESIPQIEPGKPDGYLEAATIFWDYFQFDDALRTIEQARKQTGDPLLYGYWAGAVYESKGEVAHGIAEYVRSAETIGASRSRLLELARRPAHRALIDKLTAERVAAENPDPAAVSLRVAVLDAQNRSTEATPLWTAILARTTSIDLVAAIRRDAESRGLDAVTERADEREVAITTDPVDRMRAQLALMRFYEGKRDIARAESVVAVLYRDNPAILGVVRATVDFYWRNKMAAKAVDTLASAASAANADYRDPFTLEASAKAAESGDFARAREFARRLLAAKPLDAAAIAAMADVHSRQGDDRGLRAFYEEKLAALRAASMSSGESVSRMAALRRSLIPVLTRQKDYAAGVDQYIEVLKDYAEDEGLAREAAAYASSHGMGSRLLAYFTKAAADSPRDFRWPLLAARIDTFFEDLPVAIESYARATAIRPDRVDFYVARASLEERLMRFEDALQRYSKLYDLTYRNPHWMEKVAEVHARQGRRAQAAAALEKAFIEGRPERPQQFFDVARILESWNLLQEARPFAERGAKLAGSDLLADYSGGQVYARVMTRLRAHETALERLTEGEFARQTGFGPALEAMGDAVARYFTPEEKSSLEAFLEKEKATVPATKLLPLVRRAGLAALEAKWRFALLMAEPRGAEANLHKSRLADLQQQRMQYDELGVEIEAYWHAVSGDTNSDYLLDEAAAAFRASGNHAAEVRVLAMHQQRSGLGDPWLGRYLTLLARLAPQSLLAEAGQGSSAMVRNRAVDAAIASANVSLARDAIRARGQSLPPVWARAYTGLAGVYFADTTPATGAEFLSALGDVPIGARLGKPADRREQLAGSEWFYYGTVYGEYVALARSGDPEDYLPAILEGAPARADEYVTLAGVYRDNGDATRALADYAHALELNANRGDVEDRIAVILWNRGQREAAIGRWKAAFRAFRKVQNGPLPESFWSDVPEAFRNVGSRKVLADVRAEADAVLRTYIRRNGNYRAELLVEAALETGGVEWLIDLSHAALSPLGLLQTAAESHALAKAQREILYPHILEVAAAKAAAPGPEHMEAESRLNEWRLRWIAFLLDTKQTARAQAALDTLPDNMREPAQNLEIRVAAAAGRLPALLDHYSRTPDRMPLLDTLREAAATLKAAGDAANAQLLLEFIYTRELDARNFTAANFLGLAEVRLEQGDLKGALALLRRMTLVADEPFEDLAPAAALLERTGHQTEAREFLTARVKAVPWDLESRFRLGDPSVARMPEAAYATRVDAARLAPASGLGSAELDLLAGDPVPAADAGKPNFYYARLKAAETAANEQERIHLLAGALAVNPQSKPARLALFRAALASGNAQVAVSSLTPLLENLEYALRQDEHESDSQIDYYSREFLSGESDKAQRAAVARGLGQAETQLGDLNAASLFYRIALKIEPSAEADAALARVKAEQARRDEDARRRPTIRNELGQDWLVRPRLAEGGPSK